jgi:hypothetical protein
VNETDWGDYDGDRQPWDQRGTDTSHSYRAFLVYRDLGVKRSLRRAAEVFYELADVHATHAKLRQMKHWSTNHQWRVRVNAWDVHLQRIDEDEQVQAAHDMHRRHSAIATMALQKAAERLKQLNPESLTARDAITYLEAAVRVERQARGEPDTIRELRGPGGTPLNLALDDEVLEARIAALLEQEKGQESDVETVGDTEDGDA